MRYRNTSLWLGIILFVTILAPTSALSVPYAYVADKAGSWISIIDLATDTIIKKVDLGTNIGPQDLILHPTRPHLYVTNYNAGTVSAIDISDPANALEIETINVGLNPEGLAFSPDGKKLYVAHGDDEEFVGVWKQFLTEVNIDDSSDDYHLISRKRQFAVNDASAPYAMEVKTDSQGRLKAYISGRIANKVYIVDIENLFYVYNDPTPEDPTDNPPAPAFLTEISDIGSTTDPEPSGLAVTESGLIVVACKNSNEISIITPKVPLAEITNVPVGPSPSDVAIHPSGNAVYVVNSGDSTVSIIDLSTQNPISTINVGADSSSAPEYIAVGTNGEIAYVTGYNDNTLTLIETQSDTVINTLELSDGTLDVDNLLSTFGFQGVASGEDVPFISVLEVKNFGDVSLVASSSHEFTVANKGTASLMIDSIGGLQTTAYSVNPGNCINSALNYNDTCSFTVTFVPQLVGTNSDTLSITSNAENATGGSTAIALSGNGTTDGIVPSNPKTSLSGAVVSGDSVTFTWEESTDELGRELTYLVQVSVGDTVFGEVAEGDFSFTCTSNGVILAGTGLMSLLLLGGAVRTRNRATLLLACFFAVTAITACGGGGGGGAPDPTIPADSLTTEPYTGLASGDYYWRVAAIPEGGEMSDFSTPLKFTIE